MEPLTRTTSTEPNRTPVPKKDEGVLHESVQSLAIQDDNKIVAAGYGTEFGPREFALARYKTDGFLDISFNTSGKLTVGFTGATAEGQDVAIQEDGKITASGYSLVEDAGNYAYAFALTRRNADGSPDTSFGQDLDDNGTSDGKVLTSLGSSDDRARALALQPDGKIILAGHSFNGTDDDFALTRFKTDGSPDETFDGDGKLTTAVGPGDDQAQGFALQSDGKTVAAGVSTDSITGDNFALTRYYGESYTTAPEVSKVTPTGKKVSPNTSVTASFSHKMDSLTLSNSSFRLFKKDSVKAIQAKVSYKATMKEAILNPKRNLWAGTTYKAVVVNGTDGVRDLSGNALAESKTWSFRVRK